MAGKQMSPAGLRDLSVEPGVMYDRRYPGTVLVCGARAGLRQSTGRPPDPPTRSADRAVSANGATDCGSIQDVDPTAEACRDGPPPFMYRMQPLPTGFRVPLSPSAVLRWVEEFLQNPPRPIL